MAVSSYEDYRAIRSVDTQKAYPGTSRSGYNQASMSEMPNQRSGVIAVLTYEENYLLVPWGVKTAAQDPRRERQVQSDSIPADWFQLKGNTLEFPSGGVKQVDTAASEELTLQQAVTRELREELKLEVQADQFWGGILAVGVIEQIRKGQLVSLLAHRLLVELTSQQIQFIIEQRGAISLSAAELKFYLAEPIFTRYVRPTTLLVARQALLGSSNLYD